MGLDYHALNKKIETFFTNSSAECLLGDVSVAAGIKKKEHPELSTRPPYKRNAEDAKVDALKIRELGQEDLKKLYEPRASDDYSFDDFVDYVNSWVEFLEICGGYAVLD